MRQVKTAMNGRAYAERNGNDCLARLCACWAHTARVPRVRAALSDAITHKYNLALNHPYSKLYKLCNNSLWRYLTH